MRILPVLIAIVACLIGGAAAAGPINVNTATAEELAAELNGVGLAKARAIVAYREANGPFSDIAQMARVKGIGIKLLERNRDNIRLRDPG